jgi:hypothetical protein
MNTRAGAPELQDAALLARAAAFAAIYLFWGGTFLALRYAVIEVPPMLTIAIRCAGGQRFARWDSQSTSPVRCSRSKARLKCR